MPQTGWLIKNRNLFLTVLKAESLRSGCQQWSGENPFPIASSRGGRGASSLGPLWCLIYKGTNAFHGSSIFMT